MLSLLGVTAGDRSSFFTLDFASEEKNEPDMTIMLF